MRIQWGHMGILCLLLCTGCRKDLCYDHDQHGTSVKVDAQFSWEQEWERPYDHNWKQEWKSEWKGSYDELRPEVAGGVRLVTYQEAARFGEGNIPATGGRLPLPEGMASLLFYNNDTEYIVFNDLTAVATASATTRTVSRGNFQKPHASERTMNQPDMLYGNYEENYETERTLEPVKLPVRMKPLVYTYLIRYEFKKGLQYVALARGALAGMAESVYLKDGHTGDETATILFDCTKEDYGAEVRVNTFGVPNYPGDHYIRAERRFTLNLEVKLYNGKFKNFEFDVTDQVVGQPRGGVIVVDGIEISDKEGSEGSGAFDPTVEGWGDFIDIPLPI